MLALMSVRYRVMSKANRLGKSQGYLKATEATTKTFLKPSKLEKTLKSQGRSLFQKENEEKVFKYDNRI